MFRYFAYGLHIQSPLRLPELVDDNSRARPDAVIRFGRVGKKPLVKVDGAYQVERDAIYCFWREAGIFLVHGGREIIIEPGPEIEKLVLQPFITGPLLALLLHQRGLLILHASAVEVDGAAIAFLGDKGWGKSTTAASMLMRQHRLIADDVAALDIKDDGSIQVLPAFPQIKLLPHACNSLGIDPEETPRLHPKIDKRVYSDRNGFSPAPVSLMHIYVLDKGKRLLIERLGRQEAFMELVRHSYAAKHLAATKTLASHFRQCGKVASSVATFRLKRPFVLSELHCMTKSVEQHVYSTCHQTVDTFAKQGCQKA
jgi:hypothetical protein